MSHARHAHVVCAMFAVLQESSSDLAAPLPDGMLLDNLEHREEEPEGEHRTL